MSNTLDATAIAALREQTLRPLEERPPRAAAAATILGEKLKFFSVGPEGRSDPQTLKALALYLYATGRATSATRTEWRTWVLTWVSFTLPATREKILADNPDLYQEETIPDQVAISLKEWAKKVVVAGKADAAARKEAVVRLATEAPALPGFPAVTIPEGMKIGDSLENIAVYGYFSIILFLAGKTPTDSNRPAYTEKRPLAIEGKYYAKAKVPCLSGEWKMSHAAHDGVHTSFVYMTHLRKLLFTEIATITESSAGDPNLEVLATTTRLMRNVGMSHVVIMDEFLTAHPEAFDIPLVRPSIASYAASLRTLAQTDPHLRPFFKVIHGDTTRAFNRKDVENLLVVAIKTKMETTASLQQFNLPPDAEKIYAKYIAGLKAL